MGSHTKRSRRRACSSAASAGIFAKSEIPVINTTLNWVVFFCLVMRYAQIELTITLRIMQTIVVIFVLKYTFCHSFRLIRIKFYFKAFSHSDSLNPTKTKPSPISKGLFTSMPSVARRLICSSSVIVGSLFFRSIDL